MHRLKLTAFICIFLIIFSVTAQDTSVIIGGEEGWPALSVSSSLSRGKGRLGQESLVLATELRDDASENDMYFSFDSPDFRDISGNYTVLSSTLLFAGEGKAQRGTGTALCNTSGSGMVLRGKPGSLFSTPGESGSFTIEFWLFPAVTENGSVILQWRSSRQALSGSLYQFIRASLFQNHLEWNFSNIWTTVAGKPLNVSITGRKNLIPAQWSHHRLSFNAGNGLLEYTLNGSTENILYNTSSGTEKGDVYPCLFGAPSDVEIGPRFSGLIDEFRITRASSEFSSLSDRYAVLERYPSAGGRFETMPIDSKGLSSILKQVVVVQTVPAETGISFFVRSGENIFQWTDSYPEWIPFESGDSLSGVVGRYFQIAGELYPDGRGTKTPSVTSIELKFERDALPWPPAKVFALAGNGSVELDWAASVDTDTAGYLVFYGEKSGEYLGSLSPLDAGNVLSYTVNGLTNGKIYYFSIASYDKSGMRYPGTLSPEVFARPRAGR